MIPQSATSITDFKNCPTLYYLRHVLRLRPVEDADTLRVGTNWHRCLEVLTEPTSPGEECPYCVDPQGGDGPSKDCYLCGGTGEVPDDFREALIRHFNQAYETCPPSVSLTDWEVERTILLYSALGWDWFWQDDKIETVAREISFDRQVNPVYRRRGKIDRIIRYGAALMLGEYKSTSKPIDPGSLYWDQLNLDSQITVYIIEARHAQLTGELGQYGIAATDPLISGVLYDVWHKPLIKPKKLSMADSKKFVDTGEYFGEKFEVERYNISTVQPGCGDGVIINNKQYDLIFGAKVKPIESGPNPMHLFPFAIRETPEMFGARLLADIRENPEKHFARKSIARTDEELARFDKEFYNLARVARFMTDRDLWYVNENRCIATYRCSFYPICFYNVDVSNGQVPDGFKCLKRKKQ